MNVSFLIRLVDQFTAPAQKIANSMQRMQGGFNEFADGFNGAIKAGFTIENIDEATKKAQTQLSQARGRLMGAAGMALSVFAPVKIAAGFETEMNRVRALSNATEDEFLRLQKQALFLGRTTQFTTRQAADAQGFLAMAGFKTNDIIGAMPGTLQLAASAQLDLARAADIVTNILTAYGKKTEDLAHVNDVLVKAFTSANTDLSQLAEAMKYAGPVASSAGVNFEEATAALALMGNAGIQASMAGTGLRGAMTRMLSPTKGVRAAMKEANLTFTDAKGRLLPLVDIIKQLEPHADNTGLMMQIFGQRAGPAMMALVSQGSGALEKLTEELEKSAGTAERISKVQMQGFNGMLKEMQSAAEGTAIAFGTMLFPPLIELGGILTVLMNKITDYSEAHPELVAFGVKAVAALLALSIASRLLAFAFAGLKLGLISTIGMFLKFDKAGRNVAIGWRLLKAGLLSVRATFGLVAGGARILAAGMQALGGNIFKTGAEIIKAQGKLNTFNTAARRLMAASWLWTMGFEIVDDLGRTPEERMEQIRKNHERWQKIEQDVEKSWFGEAWSGMKNRANTLMGLEEGIVPAEALAAWGAKKAGEFNMWGAAWIDRLLAGVSSKWADLVSWFDSKIAYLQSLFTFDVNIGWPEPPAWLTYLMDLAGKGAEVVKDTFSPPSYVYEPQPLPAGVNLRDSVLTPMGGSRVEQVINAEVIDKRPPQQHFDVKNSFVIHGATDPNSVAQEVMNKLNSAKSGALHGGTE